MTTGRSKTGSATVYLMEELGDARMRYAQLAKYIEEAVRLIDRAPDKDRYFEAAGHLIEGIPKASFLLGKALAATALAASRLDYEETKQELLPEKVDELERAMQDARIRQVRRRSNEETMAVDNKMWKVAESPKTAAKLSPEVQLDFEAAALALRNASRGQRPKSNSLVAVLSLASALSKMGEERAYATLMRAHDVLKASGMWDLEGKEASDEEKSSKFEEGKPADPTENMSPEDAKKWKIEHLKNKDNFTGKSAADEEKSSKFEEGKPADPTKNMSPADAKKWKEEHDKNKDQFKSAAAWKV